MNSNPKNVTSHQVKNSFQSDDYLPKSDPMESITSTTTQDQNLTGLKNLNDQFVGDDVATNAIQTLEDMMLVVTNETKHSHISFGKPVGKEKL